MVGGKTSRRVKQLRIERIIDFATESRDGDVDDLVEGRCARCDTPDVDFGANATAYIDAFHRNIDWVSTQTRHEDATRVLGPRPLVQKEFGDVPGVAVEEVKAMLDAGERVQVIDARPRSYMSRQGDIMDGAVWRDPERLDEWVGELTKTDPVVVFCAYGFHVGCKTVIAVGEAGLEAI